MKKRDNLIMFCVITGGSIFSILIMFLTYHVKAKTYYFIYPKLTTPFTYFIFIISIIILFILLIKYSKVKLIFKNNLKKQIVYIILIILFISITFGSLQYLLYINNHESFIIDNDVLKREVKIEHEQLIEIQNKYEVEKDLCEKLRNKVDENGYLRSKFIQDYMIFGLFKDNKIESYLFTIDKYKIFLRSECVEHLPPTPKGGSKCIFSYRIDINVDSTLFSIYSNKSTKKIFIDFFNSPDSISKTTLKNIINNYIVELDDKILQLNLSITLISKRGVPFSLFAYDTFMKSFSHDLNYYKPFSWWSRIFYFIHIILVIYFITPLLNPIIKKILKNN